MMSGYTSLHEKMKTQMENYTAWFQNNEANQTILLKCDGISIPHAEARAWIKFFKYEAFKRDEGNWELEALDLERHDKV